MPTVIFYPNADPETSSVDGGVQRIKTVPLETFSALRSGVGTFHLDSSIFNSVVVEQTIGFRVTLSRALLGFDTSILGTSTILSATVSVYVLSGNFQNDYNQSICLVPATLQDNTSLFNSDYEGNVGNVTRLANDISLSSVTFGAYNDFTLNAAGLTYIKKHDITNFGIKLSCDVDNIDPFTGSSAKTLVQFRASEGLPQLPPKLTITYSRFRVAPLETRVYAE